jgi:hypothetical protein
MEINKNYYLKYNKYKNKYLQLKNNMLGSANELNNKNRKYNKNKNFKDYDDYDNFKNFDDIGLLDEIDLLDKNNLNEINCAMVSHNGRLRCLLTNLYIPISKKLTLDELNDISEHESNFSYSSNSSNSSNYSNPEIKNKKIFGNKDKEVELRFKNCAIILLKIDPKLKMIEISLIHDGDVNKKKKGYYYYVQNKSSNNYEIEFPITKYTNIDGKFDNILKILHIKSEDIGEKNINIYMIRHGEGFHNTVKGLSKIMKLSSKYVDSKLTNIGITQAINAAPTLNEINFDYLFVSDLLRTRETLQQILLTNKYKKNIKKIFVLPCSHELDYVKSGLCDESQKFSMIENENKMSCKIISNTCNDKIDPILCCNLDLLTNNNIELNWKYYRQFYKDSTRNVYNKNRFHCKNTSVISMSLFIICSESNSNTKLDLEKWIFDRK